MESSDETEYEDDLLIYNSHDLLYKYLDDILELYYDFKDRFWFNPFFLGNLTIMKFTDFIRLIIYEKHIPSPLPLTKPLVNFKINCNTELQISHQIITTFLKNIDSKISIDSWSQFCFINSEPE
jgi:hypothetical protein